MKVFIASDHAAVAAKAAVVDQLKNLYEVVDLGPVTEDRVNYPDFAVKLCKKVLSEKARGILLCGSGIGMSMSANRFAGIRAALCRTEEEAMLSRQHNDANVLCLGARTTSPETIRQVVDSWLAAEFEGGRHSQRIELFDKRGEKL